MVVGTVVDVAALEGARANIRQAGLNVTKAQEALRKAEIDYASAEKAWNTLLSQFCENADRKAAQ